MRPLLAPAVVVLSAVALRAAGPEPLVPKVREAVQPEIDRHLADAQKAALAELALADGVKAYAKPPLRQRAVKEPWGALAELEARGLGVAAAAGGGLKGLPAVVDRLNHCLDRPAAESVAAPPGKRETLDDHIRYITAVLDAADKLREEALAKLSPAERAFLFDRAAPLVRGFGPQLPVDDTTRPQLRDDLAFCTAWQEKVDGPKFAAAVRTVLLLTDPTYLDELKAAMAKAAPLAGKNPDGFGGELLAVKETRHGLIVLGGGKANAYDLKRPVAFLADLGGDDTYKGVVASSFDPAHPFGLVVDFAGDDTYAPAEFGLATGRLGCGVLIDRTGNDTYTPAAGSGGCGFAGVGLLVDEAGQDAYTGDRFTLGAAVAGLGLVFDLAGDDTYTAPGYSLGIGGPCGVGAVVDVAGDDSYRCGFAIPSGYNATDAPNAKPGDPNFQYDAFGLGIGLGRRTYPFSAEGDGYNLAGGVGVWLDLAGNDRSESSNFSQACAYFFGAGLKLDLAGDDRHGAARYGHAAGAHYGLGLFLDYAGADEYVAAGPTYNIGCAWDRSVFLLADGQGDDRYDLTKSVGCGRADRGGWGVFADLAGKDTYRVGGTPGGASDKAVGVFFDGAGDDEYPKLAGPTAPANGVVRRDGQGGLFVDR
ncbi:MAG: hypothetical protein K2X87_28875 [Gemmataceae bacterium]|nr:hypothetical protein [Gemmataceae bacterium]